MTGDEWQPTGRTRLRGLWLGLLAYEVEETRMVNTWMPGTPHSPMNWRPTYHWRRVRFGGVIDLQGTVPGKRIAAHLDQQAAAGRSGHGAPPLDRQGPWGLRTYTGGRGPVHF